MHRKPSLRQITKNLHEVARKCNSVSKAMQIIGSLTLTLSAKAQITHQLKYRSMNLSKANKIVKLGEWQASAVSCQIWHSQGNINRLLTYSAL